MANTMSVVVAGGGIGGLAVAIGLVQRGVEVTVHEQAREFATVGDAINLTPNVVRALDHLGVGEQLRDLAYRPDMRLDGTGRPGSSDRPWRLARTCRIATASR